MTCCEYNRDFGIARLNCSLLSSQSSLTIASGMNLLKFKFKHIVLKKVCFGIGGSMNASENAIQRIAQSIQSGVGLKKPMQVAGCVVIELDSI